MIYCSYERIEMNGQYCDVRTSMEHAHIQTSPITLAAENVELAGYGEEPPFDRQSSILIYSFI